MADEADEADAAEAAVGATWEPPRERIMSVIVRLESVFRRGDDPQQNAAVDHVVDTVKKELLPGANAVTVSRPAPSSSTCSSTCDERGGRRTW
jgi:hypothetical protein